MLIYGNTPRDIMAMIWRRRKKFMMAFAVIVIAVMLSGCAIGNRKVSPPLQALDKFFEAIGSGDTKDLAKEKAE